MTVTIKDVYNSALSLLGEDSSVSRNEDYEERAPYLIAAFCTEAAATDAQYRKAHSLPAAEPFCCVCLPFESRLPVSERFATAAATYLAAMLVIDENTELSDKLFDKYCVIMSTIHSEIPMVVERITQKYL